MARFNPENYPDRLAFEAHARRLRSRETGRLFAAAMARLGALRIEIMHDLARRIMPGTAWAHRHLHH
jgi:hypothetical protein